MPENVNRLTVSELRGLTDWEIILVENDRKIEEEIRKCDGVTLDLSKMGLVGLPVNLAQICPDLEYLDISGNNIKYLPKNLCKLKKLNWSHNNLIEWPQGIDSSLCSLEMLDLHGNKLIQFSSEDILCLEALKELNLNGHAIDMYQRYNEFRLNQLNEHPTLEVICFEPGEVTDESRLTPISDPRGR